MKRTIAACFAGVLLFAIFAGAASAATPAARIAKLEKQMKTLTTTVNKQAKTIKTLTSTVAALIGSHEDAATIIEQMKEAGFIAVSGTKVTYSFTRASARPK